jgi:CPA1 family monovalent cation:H+ antiporter
MEGSAIHAVELVFLLLLLFVVAFASLARKLNLPYPIVLVIAGLVLSLIPGIPKVTLSPDLIFLAVLPPLLYAGAWFTSWRDFSYNIVSILFLAFGLVAFTVLAVAGVADWSFAPFDWRLGFVLGAVVATTDAIAATSIARRVGLPQRIVDVLEGESLVNDATGLLALEFGVAMVVQGHAPSVGFGLLRLIYLVGVGVAIGLVIGVIVERIHHYIDDAPIEIILTIMVPYVVYLAAEEAHASGVLGVVVCGLYLSRKSTRMFSPNTRLQAYGFWNALNFVLNGLVFVLVGLQLPFVLAGIREYKFRELVLFGALFSALLIVIRLVWTFPGAYVAYFVRKYIQRRNEERPPVRAIFVVGWTGMRGVVALAAALSLPETLADGTPFPQRNLIIFLTFCVILVTLVFQGLTLPPLIRLLGLAGASGPNHEERKARQLMLEAALRDLEQQQAGADTAGFESVYDDIAAHYRQRLAAIIGDGTPEQDSAARDQALTIDLSRRLLSVERRTVVSLRDQGTINDEVLRQIERELDLMETKLAGHVPH